MNIEPLSLEKITNAVHDAYEAVRGIEDGKNADYIPYLAHVPSDLFGISVCLPNGQTVEVGATNYIFGIESISKVATAALVLEQYGADAILQKIGANATGLPFNSIMAILLENDHPSTPLVNSGAIAACSMVQPCGDADAKWRNITNFLKNLCGSELHVIEELYKSESETNFNNRSIVWLLKKYNKIYDNPDISLDLYTRQCSLGVTANQLAIFAATIANKGVNPITKTKVLETSLTPRIVSLIATVGFYEKTGDWMYTAGIPSKTGVGGGVMGILPGILGIAAFSPKLDPSGNSVRAQNAIKHIVQSLGLHIYA